MRILKDKHIERIRGAKGPFQLDNGLVMQVPNVWKEGMEKEHIDLMMSTKDILDYAYGYWPKGNSYVFHRSTSNNYFCISRPYLLENFPEITAKLDAQNKKIKSVKS